MSLNRQLAIFSADSRRPSLDDLTGLLFGPGQLDRMGGTARVSVPVDAAWRVHALSAEFARRGLRMSWRHREELGGYLVGTSYASTLATLDTRSVLDGWRLRLWFLASGEQVDAAVVLALGDGGHFALRALAPLGLHGEVIKGPAVRIGGGPNVARLVELIGERPETVPLGAWPGDLSVMEEHATDA